MYGIAAVMRPKIEDLVVLCWAFSQPRGHLAKGITVRLALENASSCGCTFRPCSRRIVPNLSRKQICKC